MQWEPNFPREVWRQKCLGCTDQYDIEILPSQTIYGFSLFYFLYCFRVPACLQQSPTSVETVLDHNLPCSPPPSCYIYLYSLWPHTWDFIHCPLSIFCNYKRETTSTGKIGTMVCTFLVPNPVSLATYPLPTATKN